MEGIVNLVEAVHIELTNERRRVCVLKVLRQDF